MKRILNITYLLCLMLAATAGVASATERAERTPAFPGAEGWGRYVTGGRGGKVIHVTNLNDSGTGSLRWAIDQTGPRTIVFDVSGTIHLKSDLDLRAADVTIAGQTAPGDGICIADFPFSIKTRNVIIRYIRFRPGNASSTNLDGLDGLGCVDSERIMIDHCSISWATDECCSVYGNRFSTVQWCIISQSLRHGGHSKGTHGYGGMMGGEGATYHHNLLAHHDSRAPRLGERPATGPRDTTDFRNNVMYNWSGQGCYGCENMNVNIVGNYYKPGSATNQRDIGIRKRICGVGVNENPNDPMYLVWSTLFVEGNVNSKYEDVTADNWTIGIWNQLDAKYRTLEKYGLDESKMHLTEPVKYYHVTTHSADDAFNRVLDYAGASLSRDSHDALMASDTRNGEHTYTGSGSGNGKGIIDSPLDNRPVDAPDDWTPWPVLNSTAAPVDTDRDGMPDEWEIANGLNPDNADDRNVLNAEGYTMLEVYINSIVEHITEAQNAGGTESGYKEYVPEALNEYIISADTREDNSWSFGHGITLSNTSNSGYTTSGEYIGVARDVQHTISLPEGAEITWIEAEGRARYSTDKYPAATLSELNGNAYADGQYSLPKGDAAGSFSIVLDKPASNSLTMTWTGNNPYLKLILHTTSPLGVSDVTDGSRKTDNRWFNLQGIEVDSPSVPGLYIHNGKKILIK